MCMFVALEERCLRSSKLLSSILVQIGELSAPGLRLHLRGFGYQRFREQSDEENNKQESGIG